MSGAAPLIIVTGATDGIGQETALELARRGARVIVHGRSEGKTEAVRAAIARETGRPAEPALIADLASLSQVRAMAEAFVARGEPLDVLVNNAGIFSKTLSRTDGGVESTFAVNHLAPFLMTHLLLDALRLADSGRVVNVSSVAHTRGAITLADLDTAKAPFSGYGAYASSKQANVLFTVELSRRLGAESRVTVNALHPGVVSTKVLLEGFGMQGNDSLAEGARTSVFLALDPSVKNVRGQYFVRAKPAPASPSATAAELARAFYLRSAELVGAQPLPEPR